jgi:Family of unknown function (DUF5808)/Protein of unknown function (DUF1648)
MQVIIGSLVSSMLPSTTFPGPVAACACVLVVIGVVAWLAPGLPRGLFFSVAVQPWLRSTPEGSHVLWWYRMKVALHTLIGFVLLVLAYPAAGTPVPWFVAMLSGLGWQLGGCFFAFQGARRQVLPHGVDSAAAQEAETLRRRVELPGGWTLQAGPFAALAGAALYLRWRWAELPERFPIHWGFDGRPNGWANRNPAGVFGPLLIAAVAAGSMALFSSLLRRDRNTRGAEAAGAAERRFRRAVLWSLLATEYVLVLVSIQVSLLPLAAAAAGGTAGPPRIAPFVALILIFVVTVTIILARIGRGARLEAARDGAAKRQSGGVQLGLRSPESSWKAGIFYVNPDDPALFVQKRLGIGYTLNFAHPLSWLILGLSILAPLAVALWIQHTAR